MDSILTDDKSILLFSRFDVGIKLNHKYITECNSSITLYSVILNNNYNMFG